MENIREIRQLWFIAQYYFNLSKELKMDIESLLDTPLSFFKESFSKGYPSNKNTINATYFIAHLSSSAIRLATINEKLNYRLTNRYKEEFDKNITIEQLTDILFNKRNKYLHLYLRDNTGHIENDSSNKLWVSRQYAIEKMTIDMIYSSLEIIINDYRNNLNMIYNNLF